MLRAQVFQLHVKNTKKDYLLKLNLLSDIY